MTTDPPADLLSVRAAARLHPSCRPGKRLHYSTLYRWIAQGKLRSWKLGVARYVSRREVLALLREEPAPGLPEGAAAQRRRHQAALDGLRARGYRV